MGSPERVALKRVYSKVKKALANAEQDPLNESLTADVEWLLSCGEMKLSLRCSTTDRGIGKERGTRICTSGRTGYKGIGKERGTRICASGRAELLRASASKLDRKAQ